MVCDSVRIQHETHRSEVQRRLRTAAGIARNQAATPLLLDQLPKISRRSLVDLAGSLPRIDAQRVSGARHCDVKQAALFLLMHRLVIGTGIGVGIPQFTGESHQLSLYDAGNEGLKARGE